MKTIRFIFPVLLLFMGSSCGDYGDYGDYGTTITSPIVLSNTEHHVGDNTGAEGLALTADFTMPSSFSYAQLKITFKYPNSKGISGFDADAPPAIYINGSKIGVYTSDFAGYSSCIDAYREFSCTVTFTYAITSYVTKGDNTFRIESVGFASDADDFVFSDVLVEFE